MTDTAALEPTDPAADTTSDAGSGPASCAEAAPPACTVLYVGAHPAGLQALEDEGCHLLHARQTAAGLSAMSRYGVDLVICDLRESPDEGLAFLEAAQRGWPDINRLALGPAQDCALLVAALNGGGIIAYIDTAAHDLGKQLRSRLQAAARRKLAISAHGQLRKIEALSATTQLFDAIVDNLPIAVQIKSVQDEFRIVRWNKAAESLFGLSRDEALGRNVYDLWPHADPQRMHNSDLEVIGDGGVHDFRDRRLQTPHRGMIRAHLRKVPLYAQDGTPTHLIVLADDVTAQLDAEAALREAQARYQRALDGSQDGLWEFDLRDGKSFMSERMRSMLGLEENNLPRQQNATSHLVHPEDLPAYRDAYINLLKSGKTLEWEGRFRQPNGGYRWFRVRGVATHGPDGLAILASGTTTDIDATKRVQDELRRHRDDLAGMVRERTASLTAAMRAAEAANHAKSEFLANMSHELRTPMHAIISFANFGVEKFERVDRARLKGYFEHIQRSAGRLLSLLNDLLDLSKLEAGKMELAPARVHVLELLRDAAQEAEALAEHRLVRLHVIHPGGLLAAHDALPVDQDDGLSAWWDGPRVLQVLRNLLSNAVKFSPSGGVIELSACPVALKPLAGAPARVGIEIRVRDQGVGIPPQELETVFDKFVQSSKTKTGAGGTGLGLAISREIVQAHGGTIRAEHNPPPQSGVCFVVRLPANPLNVAARGTGTAPRN